MYKFYRSDLIDELVNRYIKTFNYLEGKQEPLGVVHKCITDNVYKNLKLDVSEINLIGKHYAKFNIIKRLYYYRVEKLKFKLLSAEEMSKLGLFERLGYWFKSLYFAFLSKNFEKKKIKFKLYLPSELYNVNVDVEEVKPVTVSEVITAISDKKEEIKKEVPALNSAEEKPKEEKKDKDAKSEIPPGQIAIELDNFFNSNSPAMAQEEIKA